MTLIPFPHERSQVNLNNALMRFEFLEGLLRVAIVKVRLVHNKHFSPESLCPLSMFSPFNTSQLTLCALSHPQVLTNKGGKSKEKKGSKDKVKTKSKTS